MTNHREQIWKQKKKRKRKGAREKGKKMKKIKKVKTKKYTKKIHFTEVGKYLREHLQHCVTRGKIYWNVKENLDLAIFFFCFQQTNIVSEKKKKKKKRREKEKRNRKRGKSIHW